MKEKIFEKGIVRRLFSVVLAMAMVVSLSTLNSMVVHADSTHTEHGTALTAAGGTLTTGNPITRK